MTGGFLINMSSNQCWTILHMSILAGLLLTLHADSEDLECSIEIRVRRNTVYKVSPGEELRINCTVVYCNNSPPTVSWHKVDGSNVPVSVSNDSHIETKWTSSKDLEGVSYLIFKNILKSDSGQYQCQSGGSMSHVIDVSVSDELNLTTVSQKNDINNPTTSPEQQDDFLMYVYSAAGIGSFVIIVIIISVISMQGCKGKPKKGTQTENPYMEIPMTEQPQASLQPSQGRSPSGLPSRRSTKRKTPSRQPNDLTLSRDNEQAYSQIQGSRDRQRNTPEEEGSSVVYAALNHELPPRAARSLRPTDETSEYAAIRVA